MSYIIAMVQYPNNPKSFPSECFRTDLKLGDKVVVRRADGKLVIGEITELQYLNWDCQAKIECKLSEADISSVDIKLPTKSSISHGLTTTDALIKTLRTLGWVPLKSRQTTYRIILFNTNNSQTAFIFVRKNGVDLQIHQGTPDRRPEPFSIFQGKVNDGRCVKHFLAHTKFNLFEGIVRFSNSFLGNEENLDRYFIPVGNSDKRNDKLKSMSEAIKQTRSEMSEIYSAASDGSGGPAYLSDGVWIDSDGDLHDWGR